MWRLYAECVPIVRREIARGQWPVEFAGLNEFVNVVPTLQRGALAKSIQDYTVSTPLPNSVRTTGGSTAEPIRIPSWKSEYRSVAASQWLGRYRHGVSPADRLFMLWGHSHILGAGLRGKVNGWKRGAFDRMLGYCRASAYDLSESALRSAGRRLIDFKPTYVYGYSVALSQFALANKDRKSLFKGLHLKFVQATAESFPSDESRALVQEVFGCPVIMEYGAMESGHIASTSTHSLGYDIYWKDFLVEAIKEREGLHKLVLTSLYPRATPLIRYELGDLIALDASSRQQEHVVGLRAFDHVGGRCNYGVRLSDNSFFHSEVFTHCIRDIHGVAAFQVVQECDHLVIQYTGSSQISEVEIEAARQRFEKIDPRLRGIEFKLVDELIKNRAGKNQMIVIKQPS